MAILDMSGMTADVRVQLPEEVACLADIDKFDVEVLLDGLHTK